MKIFVLRIVAGLGLVAGQDMHYISLGPRPFWLLDHMRNGALKTMLEECAATKTSYQVSDFSIGHRGAALQFPEHTFESYAAAALAGAGIIECDVTFSKDRQLVCRHSQCDLHTTTDVVARPELNAKCTVPFSGNGTAPMCCTSDFTLEEIKMLCAKMDSSGSVNASTPEEYVYGGTPDFRTDLYQYVCPEIPTHKESIEFSRSKGAKFTPELKGASVEMPYEGDYTQEKYAQQMIDEYIEMGIPPEDVWPQSFNESDIFYWVQNTDYGDQAVALDESHIEPEDFRAWHQKLKEEGVKIVAPPLWLLVSPSNETVTTSAVDSEPAIDSASELGIIPSLYALSAKQQGLDIISWTLERSDPGPSGWYWQTLEPNMDLVEGDAYSLLYVLAHDIGVLGVFSDWPATTTFFANCMNISLRSDGTGSPNDGSSDPTSQASYLGLLAAWSPALWSLIAM